MSEFQREERYIVVKLKRIGDEEELALREFLQSWQMPTEECVVVEHDWPNYEHTWETIKQVFNGTFDPDQITTLRTQLEQAEARVAELETYAQQLICSGTGPLAEASDKSPIGPLILRKQAEAVESLSFPTMLRKMHSGREVQDWIESKAQRLRQQADEAEK